jgi:hypothetical protein
MKTKNIIVASSFILAFGMANSASADTLPFLFSPTGTGLGAGSPGSYALTIDTMDQAPGSALAVQGVLATQGLSVGVNDPATGLPCSTCFDLLYQANLSTTSLGGVANYLNGLPTSFNYTLKLVEKVLPGADATQASFTSLSGIFNMYVGAGNNLTGAGFGVGPSILSANLDLGGIQTSSFRNEPGQGQPLLDQFNTDSWSGTNTVVGGGVTQLTLKDIAYDTAYFSGLGPIMGFNINAAFNTSQVTPFNQADPSLCFNWALGAGGGLGACAAGTTASNVGATNGTAGSGPDFIFQADANTAFKSTRIPEPSTLFMLGLGLAGISMMRKRNKA